MTKMATMPIYGKLFKYLLLWNQKAIGFGTWYVALGMWALPGLHKWWILVDLDLLYGKVKLDSRCIYMGKILKRSFFFNCLSRNHNTCEKCLT